LIRTALLQITAGDRPCDNLPVTLEMVCVADAAGAGFCIDPRGHQLRFDQPLPAARGLTD